MSIGIGVTNPKLAKGGRKLKKTKHCTIPKILNKEETLKSFWSRIENSYGKGKKNHREENEENAPVQVWWCLKCYFRKKKK